MGLWAQVLEDSLRNCRLKEMHFGWLARADSACGSMNQLGIFSMQLEGLREALVPRRMFSQQVQTAAGFDASKGGAWSLPAGVLLSYRGCHQLPTTRLGGAGKYVGTNLYATGGEASRVVAEGGLQAGQATCSVVSLTCLEKPPDEDVSSLRLVSGGGGGGKGHAAGGFRAGILYYFGHRSQSLTDWCLRGSCEEPSDSCLYM